MKILYDYDNKDVEFITEEVLNEDKKLEKKYKIRGVFSTIEERNRNGRVYPRNLWEQNVAKYQSVISSGSKNRLCEWQHPERSEVDPMQAVAAINKLWIDGKYVMGEATLLNNEKANQLKSLIDNGIKISVSSRGVGTVKNGIVEKFDLITYDLVDTPSDYNATMDGYITESTKSFEYNENGMIVECNKEDIKTENTELSKEQISEKVLCAFDKFFEKLK